MIATALIAGLAGAWLWVVLNAGEGPFKWPKALLEKTQLTSTWVKCAWCSGAWFAGAFSVLLHHPSWVEAGVTAMAAAAVTAIVGTYYQED